MAKRTRRRGETPRPPGRRGGRKPGKWELVDPLEFRTWREQHRLSRARLAALLSVSATSIQNWEVGHAVPSHPHQQRLAELMKTPGVASLAAGARPGGPAAAGDDPATIGATGAIVTAYLRRAPDLDQEELLGLIRAVRQALA
ncbi:MAG: helix-turn-helix domain-containing protein [Planctomycetes bacterium]|nr:helix-turn-helix domain-containing protein [Planctomycetota bacterium]